MEVSLPGMPGLVQNALTVLSLLIGAAALLLYFFLKRKLRKFFSETGHEEFGEVLLSHQRQLRRGQDASRDLEKRVSTLESESNFLLSQVGLVRYNPFEDSGGNMSFSMAMLNNNGDGAVITSLHSREGMRLYSKSIKGYLSDQTLTKEEKEAVEKARRATS